MMPPYTRCAKSAGVTDAPCSVPSSLDSSTYPPFLEYCDDFPFHSGLLLLILLEFVPLFNLFFLFRKAR